MATPWEVTGDDIESFADRVSAAAVFPDLVRRLILATADVQSIDFRADGGVRLGGYDGVVEVQAATEWIPIGRSTWELSVSAQPATKLRADFNKRVATVSESPPAAYVAVFARRVSRKSELRDELSKRGLVHEVRVLDADDIALWLTTAPAVREWFVRVLGRSLDQLRSVDHFIDDWARRTTPPLPAFLALVGRERTEATNAIRAFLSSSSRSLSVRAEHRDDAAIFVAATLADREPIWAQRAVVVDAVAGMAAVATDEQLLLVLDFPDARREAPRARGKTITIEDLSTEKAEALTLDPIPFQLLSPLLTNALALPEQQAKQFARECAGRLVDLQRSLGYRPAPPWVRPGEESALAALLLIGGWLPHNAADQAAVVRLGLDAEQAESLCARLSSSDGSPMRTYSRHGDSTYEWVAENNAWAALSRFVTTSLLNRFRDLAVDVLSTPDSSLDLPAIQRAFVVSRGAQRHSGVLRAGLADTLARLSVAAELPPAVQRQTRGIVAEVVRTSLPIQRRAWASLGGLLGSLAEAAPDAFLECLGRSLDATDDGVARLFEEAPNFWGASPHDSVVHAIERLAWFPAYVTDAVEALVRLGRETRVDVATDVSVRRPIHPAIVSLATMLRPVFPQSTTTSEERLALLRAMFKKHTDLAFRVAESVIPRLGGGVYLDAARPRHRVVEPTSEEWRQRIISQTEATVRMMLGAAERHIERWTSLLELSTRVDAASSSSAIGVQILDGLLGLDPPLREHEGVLWPMLRSELYLTSLWSKSERFRPDVVDRLERLYEQYTPSDPVTRVAWLFVYAPDFPGDPTWDVGARVEEAARRRRVALDELWREHGLATIERLAEAAPDPELPDTLAEMAFALDVEVAWVRAPAAGEPSPRVVGRFLAQRSRAWGRAQLESVLRALVAAGRTETAERLAVNRAADDVLWGILDDIGEPLRTRYWSAMLPLDSDLSSPQFDRSLSEMLALGHVERALHFAAMRTEKLSARRALEVLERACEMPLAQDGARVAHELAEVYGVAAAERSGDDERLRRIEIAFLPILAEQHLDLRLFDDMSRDPAVFTEMVVHAHLPDDAVLDDDDATDNVGQATRGDVRPAFRRALDAWHGVPGYIPSSTAPVEALTRWSRGALTGLAARGYRESGSEEVARVLVRAPAGFDGLWPNEAVRGLVEDDDDGSLASHLVDARFNMRGVTSRAVGEGGTLEHDEAADYRAAAARLRADHPRTARMVDRLAYELETWAELLDEDARARRLRWGIERPARSTDGLENGDEKVSTIGSFTILDIENFRVLESIERLRLGAVTVVFGPNGSGKTSLLHLLRFLHTALDRGTEHALAALGGGAGLLHDGAKGPYVRIGIETDGLRYQLSLVAAGPGLSASPGERLYWMAGERFLIEREMGDPRATLRRSSDGARVQVDLPDPSKLVLERLVDDGPAAAELSKLRGLLMGVELIGSRDINLHSVRTSGSQMGASLKLDPAGSNLWFVLQGLYNARQFEPAGRYDTIVGYMRKAFPAFDDVGLVAVQSRVYGLFKMKDVSRPVESSNVADGELQLLLLLVALFGHERGSPRVLLLDEPDLSLNPSAIVVLARAIREATTSWSRQVVIVTHSPVLLSQFEAEAIVFERHEGHTRARPVSEIEGMHELLADYALGALYESEQIGRQSADVTAALDGDTEDPKQ